MTGAEHPSRHVEVHSSSLPRSHQEHSFPQSLEDLWEVGLEESPDQGPPNTPSCTCPCGIPIQGQWVPQHGHYGEVLDWKILVSLSSNSKAKDRLRGGLCKVCWPGCCQGPSGIIPGKASREVAVVWLEHAGYALAGSGEQATIAFSL